jgi:hypothetical protein
VMLSLKLIIVLLPVVLVIWLTRDATLVKHVFWSLMPLFILAPGLGLQSLSWLVVFFLIVFDLETLGLFVGLSVFHMILSYWGIHFTPNLYTVLPDEAVNALVQFSAVPVWIFLLFVGIRRVLREMGYVYA